MADRIDLNCDLGEELDAWEPGVDGLDTLLLDVVTSANVACGFHAGDERIMAAVCRAAAATRGGRRRARLLPRPRALRPPLRRRPRRRAAGAGDPADRDAAGDRPRRGYAGGLREAARGAVQHGRPPRGARAGGRRRDHGPAGAGAAGIRRCWPRRAREGCVRCRRRSPTAATARTGRSCRARSRARWSRTRTRWPPGCCGWRRTGWSSPSTAPRSPWRPSRCACTRTPPAPRCWRARVRVVLVEHGVAIVPFVA